MKGARRRAGGANGPRGFSDDELCPENIYKIYDENQQSKERFTQEFLLRLKFPSWSDDEATNFTHTLFDDLNTLDLESHAKRIFDNNKEPRFSRYPKKQEIFRIPAPPYMTKDPEIVFTHLGFFRIFFPKDLTNEEKEEERKEINEIVKQKLRESVMLYRAKKEKEEPKNLIELLKKINPYCDPDKAKIEKVLEEYKKFKELDSGEEDLQKKQECKTALKQAINDALKTYTPPQTSDHLKKINDILKEYNSTPITHFTPPWAKLLKPNFTSPEALESILFKKELMDENKPRIKTPTTKLESLDDFKKFLTENVSTNLDESYVNKAFEAYETYYKEVLSLQNYELLNRLKEKATTKVSDHEFNRIVSFLDRMLKAELNASSAVNKPLSQKSAQVESIDEHEPDAQLITVEDINRDKVVDIKRDKVAEFKKFLEDNQLNCSGDNIQKVFALHELYEAYQPHLEKSEGEIQGEISVSAENLKAFKDQISGLIFKKESSEGPIPGFVQKSSISESPIPGFVPTSSIHEPRVKLDQNKLEKILTFLNENQESEKIDNGWETSNPPLDLHDESQTIIKNVELFKENKKVAITKKLASWYSKEEGGNKIQEAFIAYESYANAASIQDKQAHKAIILSKLTEGDQDVSKNLKALKFLKILDELNKNHIDTIKKARGKAMREKPNEIIKFFFEDLPSNILRAFDYFRTDDSKPENKGPSSSRD